MKSQLSKFLKNELIHFKIKMEWAMIIKLFLKS